MNEIEKELGIFKKYYDLWEDFKNKIIYENRYFLSHEVLDLLLIIANKSKNELEVGTLFYRARIFHEKYPLNIDIYAEEKLSSEEIAESINRININETPENIHKLKSFEAEVRKYESKFWGYDKGENLMPPKEIDVDNGRANPQYIRYLYLADSKYTALSEVRPKIDDKVSIAEIMNKEKLLIADLSVPTLGIDKDLEHFQYFIMNEFSISNSGIIKQYIPTQYIIEFLKHNGFNGVKYRSSLHKGGKNFVFFDDKEFDDINSKVYKLNNVQFFASCANSELEKGLFDNYHLYPKPVLDSLMK